MDTKQAATRGTSPQVMSTEQLATFLDVSYETAAALLRSKAVRRMRVGNGQRAKYRTREDWVLEYMDSVAEGGPCERTPEPQPEAVHSLRRAH